MAVGGWAVVVVVVVVLTQIGAALITWTAPGLARVSRDTVVGSVTIPRVDCSYVFFFYSCFTHSSPRRLPSPCMTPVDDM